MSILVAVMPAKASDASPSRICEKIFSVDPSIRPEMIKEGELFTRALLNSQWNDTAANEAKKLYEHSELFRRFFERATGAKEFIPDLASSQLIGTYYSHFMARFKNPDRVAALRNLALKRALEAHGVRTQPGRTAREALEELSARNLKRILGEKFDDTTYLAHADIRKMVESVMLYVTRNDHSSDVFGDNVLSSYQLEEYGTPGGLNSHELGKQILKTDDQVFFLIMPGTKTQKPISALAQYGRYSKELQMSYAREHGWVSYYVMWNHDLAWFIDQHVNVAEKDKEPLHSLHASNSIEGMDQSVRDFAVEMTSKLHQLDFTIPDFETLVRTLLGHELLRLKQTMTPEDWSKFIDQRQGRQDLGEFVQDKIMQQLGLRRMELKVPVLVPRDAFVKPAPPAPAFRDSWDRW